MTKMLNIGAAVAAASIGSISAARVRVQDGKIQLRFGDRSNTSNLPKGETLRSIGVKGSGRRISLPAGIADAVEVGAKVVLRPGKYGWFTVDNAGTETPGGSISAK